MIVIIVIAILAAITIVAYTNVQARANDTARFAAARDIRSGLELYRLDHGDYPLLGGGNVATCEHPSSGGGHCAASDLEEWLVPEYLSAMPSYSGDPDTIAYTARGNDGYALRLINDAVPDCRYRVVGDDPGRFNTLFSGAPACS